MILKSKGYNARDGIHLTSYAYNNTILDNTVIGFHYGVNVASSTTTNGTIIKNNYFYLQTTAGVNNAGGGSIIKYNVGFVTENSGSTPSCVNGTDIAHGLAGAPNGLISFSLVGSPFINYTSATTYARYLTPSALSVNSTYVKIEFDFEIVNAGAVSIYPVTALEAKTVYWSWSYQP
jgi:hypothetical protein